MRKMTLLIMVAVLGLAYDNGTKAASQLPLDYPETIAVLRLIYTDQIHTYMTDVEFARKARSENKTGCEALFKALAMSELIQADNIGDLLVRMGRGIPDVSPAEFSISRTRANLKSVKNLRLALVDIKYTFLLEQMKDEKNSIAIDQVTQAWKVMGRQSELVSDILSRVEAFLGIGNRIPETFYVCRHCGTILYQMPEQTCPDCQSKDLDYLPVDSSFPFQSYTNDKNARE